MLPPSTSASRPTLGQNGRFRRLAFGHKCAVLVLLLSSSANADAFYDHRGAVGLLLSGGVEHDDVVSTVQAGEIGNRLTTELGGTWANDNGNEWLLLGRASWFGPTIAWAASAGYRGYFGAERVRTYFDLLAMVHLAPQVSAGPRLDLGVQYELGNTVGVFAQAGVNLGFGGGLRFGAEVLAGFQFRSYLLE